MASAGAIAFAEPGEADDVDEHHHRVLRPVEAGRAVAGGQPLDHGRGEVAGEVGLLPLQPAPAAALVGEPQHLDREPAASMAAVGGSAASQTRSSDEGELQQAGQGRQQRAQDQQRQPGRAPPGEQRRGQRHDRGQQAVERAHRRAAAQAPVGQDVVDRGRRDARCRAGRR